MYIPRILRNAAAVVILLFLMVANCAPALRPREGRQVSGEHRKGAGSPPQPAQPSSAVHYRRNNNSDGVKRHYRWSTRCTFNSTVNDSRLIRFLPLGGIDARGDVSDPYTDVLLVSEGPGLVKIQSPYNHHYLCFTKKGKLVTRSKLSKNVDLCLFYEEPVDYSYSRYRCAYSRSQRTHAAADANQLQYNVPLPSHLAAQVNWTPASASKSAAERHRPSDDAWYVGFAPSGAPLLGSEWRGKKAEKNRCFEIVNHQSHVSSTPASHPFNEEEMNKFYLQVINSRRMATDADVGRPAKSSPRRHKATKGAPKSHKKSVKLNDPVLPSAAKLSKLNRPLTAGRRKAQSRDALSQLPPVLLSGLRTDEVDVEFDSYLQETEQLLRASHHPPTTAPSTSAGHKTHRAAFILLDSGGWKEVEVEDNEAADIDDDPEPL